MLKLLGLVLEWSLNETKEEAIVKVLKRENFFYPLEIEFAQEPPIQNFPWLPPSKFLHAMSRMNDLSRVLGGRKTIDDAKDLLQEFWTLYRRLFPNHQVFADFDSGAKTPERSIPLLLHGDEGTTYKRSGVLCLSWQGVLGRGSSKRKSDNPGSLAEGIRLNFLQTGVQTRMLILMCHKDWCWVYACLT